MDLTDARRLSITALVAVVGMLLWVFFLFLDKEALFETKWTSEALQALDFTEWLGISASIAGVALATLALIIFAVPDAPRGLTKASLRQVQCQGCMAVFFIRDTGHRPLTHVCPSCRALGVYDGTAPPVGEAPKASKPKKIIHLDLTCRRCHHRFEVTDTGSRPMQITCPQCQAIGEVL